MELSRIIMLFININVEKVSIPMDEFILSKLPFEMTGIRLLCENLCTAPNRSRARGHSTSLTIDTI